MDYKEFESNRKKKTNFNLTPKGELTFRELFCTIINDGDDPYTMPISEGTFNVIMGAVLNVFLPIRIAYGKGLVVSSGIRSLASYNRLKAKGYNPAKTSDHFFGQDIGGYKLSAGAFDIVPADKNPEAFFKFLLDHLNRKTNELVFPNGSKVKVGQILIEKGKVSKWIHISADRTKLNSKAAPYSIRVGESMDNGKSFVKR